MIRLSKLIASVLPRVTAIELPIELNNGNDGRGSKWFNSAKVRGQLEHDLRAKNHVYDPLDFPVVLVVTRILGPRQRFWDFSSGFRGNWKELEDAMVACGWFHDDKPEWIANVLFDQVKLGREKPAVLVEIFKAEPIEETLTNGAV